MSSTPGPGHTHPRGGHVRRPHPIPARARRGPDAGPGRRRRRAHPRGGAPMSRKARLAPPPGGLTPFRPPARAVGVLQSLLRHPLDRWSCRRGDQGGRPTAQRPRDRLRDLQEPAVRRGPTGRARRGRRRADRRRLPLFGSLAAMEAGGPPGRCPHHSAHSHRRRRSRPTSRLILNSRRARGPASRPTSWGSAAAVEPTTAPPSPCRPIRRWP